MSSQPGNNCTAVRITEKARPAEARPEHGATERPFIICQRAARGRERTTRGQGFRRITSRNNSSMTASVVRAWGFYANICHGENIFYICIWDTVLDCWVPTPLLESFGLALSLTLCKAHSVSCPLLRAVRCCRRGYPLRSSSFVAWRVKNV